MFSKKKKKKKLRKFLFIGKAFITQHHNVVLFHGAIAPSCD